MSVAAQMCFCSDRYPRWLIADEREKQYLLTFDPKVTAFKIYVIEYIFFIVRQFNILNVAGLSKALVVYKVYQTMFRVVKESETVDSRQHCFLLQSAGHEPRYLSVETRQELLRIENSWNAAIVTSVIKLGIKN
uniref:Uncharacterized protein n=1 Tax=Glossina brevipalpis TaxID=37001 RepID=A0A1A9WR79_9MUSC